MTAKQLLHEFIDGLSEEDAAVTASMLLPSFERKLTQAEIALIELGLAQADAGELIPIEEIEAELDNE